MAFERRVGFLRHEACVLGKERLNVGDVSSSGSVPRNLDWSKRGSVEEGGKCTIPPVSASVKDQFRSRVELGTVC